MGRYAADEIEEALERTRNLLLPFRWKDWARLMVIVVFAGGGFNVFNLPTSLPSDTGSNYGYEGTAAGDTTGSPVTSAFSSSPLTGAAGLASLPGGAMIAVVAALAVIFLILFVLNSIFQFIFYQSLLNNQPLIRKNFRRHFWRGIRYAGFRLGVLLLVGSGIAALVALFSLNPALGIIGALIGLLMLIPLAVFLGLTQNFVLLKMMERKLGVIAAWRDFWPDVRSQPVEVLLYVLIRFGLKVITGLLNLFWMAVSLLILLVPFGILGLLAYVAGGWMLAAPVALLGLTAWMIALLLAAVAIQTYLYYYAVLVYHDLTA